MFDPHRQGAGAPKFSLRLPDDLMERPKASSRRRGRSLNTEIAARLVASLDADTGLNAETDATDPDTAPSPRDVRDILEEQTVLLRAIAGALTAR